MTHEKLCPECQENLVGQDILAHRDRHYPKGCPNPEFYPLSAERYKQLTAIAGKEV